MNSWVTGGVQTETVGTLGLSDSDLCPPDPGPRHFHPEAVLSLELIGGSKWAGIPWTGNAGVKNVLGPV